MKSIFLSLIALGMCGTMFAADEKPAANKPAAQFKDNRDKVSYSYGVNLANTFKPQGFEVNPEELANGARDALAGKAKLEDKEVRETLISFNQELRNKRMEKMRVDAEKNKVLGEQWLAENARKPSVKTFPDGLQYKVLVSGKGPQPKPTDTVAAHYKGTLTDGTEFDSSYTRGQPLTRPVIGLIAGWQEALTNMHVGDKWELYVPGTLAYGERGSPPKIGPNATLVFEMELVGIEPPQTNAPAFPSINAGAPQIKVQPAPGANTPLRVQPAQPAQPRK
jgi:FKBP-type peptidyl-prolyl cis-trans isomerase FklB